MGEFERIAGKVQENQGGDDLLIGPPLCSYMHTGTDMIGKTQDRCEVKIDRKSCICSHAGVVFFFFVLVRKDTLWHNMFTSLMIDFVG